MEELKEIIAKNITELRRRQNLTQAELAERLNYSDKAVSKWERGESLPDVSVLKAIADMAEVTVDYLLSDGHEREEALQKQAGRRRTRNRMIITGMCILLVWLIATFVFVNVDIIGVAKPMHWLAFVYAVPASLIVWLVFNSLWFSRRRNFLIISLLMWTTLAAVYITLFSVVSKVWLIFVIGVPAQLIILLWSGIRPRSKK